jgi:hypothetical protein
LHVSSPTTPKTLLKSPLHDDLDDQNGHNEERVNGHGENMNSEQIAPTSDAIASSQMSLPLLKPLAQVPEQKHQSNQTKQQRPKTVIPYQETIRNHADRKKMHAFDCPCCEGYYKMTADLLANTTTEQQAVMQIGRNQSSRHRRLQERSNTPEGFWKLGF